MIKNFFKIKNIFISKQKLLASILPSSIKLIYLPKIKIMRKLLLGTLFLLSLSMNAQENDTQRRNIIKTNVTAFAFKNFQLNYEF